MQFFNLHTHEYTGQKNVLELINQYPLDFDATVPYYSIGIHPWRIIEANIDNELAIIESKLNSENCLAIGECGDTLCERFSGIDCNQKATEYFSANDYSWLF